MTPEEIDTLAMLKKTAPYTWNCSSYFYAITDKYLGKDADDMTRLDFVNKHLSPEA